MKRFQLTREMCTPKEFDKKIEREDLKAVVYYLTSQTGKPSAKGFTGKKAKSDFFYTFSSPERREQYVQDWFSGLQTSIDMKAKRKAERQKPNELKEGDILHFSWGYDQTNNDFYQVLESKKQTVTLHKIASSFTDREGGCSMSGYVIPLKDHFLADKEPFKKRVSYGNCVSMASYGYCGLWDGKECYESWYA